jgi:hypothetical protein
MPPNRISVFLLNEYWHAIGKLTIGQSMKVLSAWEMPTWETLCSELSWRFHMADGGYFGKKHHGFCGVYRLVALETDGDLERPAPLNRLCGQDATGTLYIGQAGRLNERLNQLRRSLHSGEGSHQAITRLKSIPKLDLPPSKLAIALLFTSTNTCDVVEGDLLKAYMHEFGDTPPLNFKP